ncbi:GNAT family N-acetyltransferase [Psychromonas sp. KJ10-2]|uniref:GNAT family N-acetyltransferase n=1 Tax=Psychromonas sp. KJ10-2 TaxID=3391822 RepID=UPI0039B6DF3E
MGYSKSHEFCSDSSIGLKSLAIDSRYQVKGIGAQFMKVLPKYLSENYADNAFIYLTVNCKNHGTINCYKKAGFEDTAKLYLGGLVGPQHIMRRK